MIYMMDRLKTKSQLSDKRIIMVSGLEKVELFPSLFSSEIISLVFL